LLKKVERLVAANPDIMKMEIRHAQDGDYKADIQVRQVPHAPEFAGGSWRQHDTGVRESCQQMAVGAYGQRSSGSCYNCSDN
jgi:hypothetical protein